VSDSTAEEKIEVTKQELKELIDERVEQRLKHEKQEQETRKENQVSRRNFLKKIGAGALGLGALTLPTSALNLRSNNLQYYGGENETDVEFEIDSNGNISAHNTLDMNNNKITGLNNPDNPSDAATQNWVNNNADVPNADFADTALKVQVLSNDPANPSNGQIWIIE
jgi:hypothetical protein